MLQSLIPEMTTVLLNHIAYYPVACQLPCGILFYKGYSTIAEKLAGIALRITTVAKFIHDLTAFDQEIRTSNKSSS